MEEECTTMDGLPYLKEPIKWRKRLEEKEEKQQKARII